MNIAVVGTGIAGLGAAYVLSRTHAVELFERNSYAGGHANTVSVERNGGELALDTGFIVHNERNYPLFLELTRELGVRSVLLHPDAAVGTPWEGAATRPTTGLGVERARVGDVIVFRLR